MNKYFCITLLFINSVMFAANATSSVDAINENSITLEKLPNDLPQLNFKAVGKAKFSVLFWDIYNSTLYTKSGHYLHENLHENLHKNIHEKTQESLIFEIEYLKDITTDDLLEQTVKQWKHLKISELVYSKYIPQLKGIWPNITSGDKLTMLVQNKQSVFYFNHVKVGHIEEAQFSKLFLDIWLSPNTSEAELRSQLLGETK